MQKILIKVDEVKTLALPSPGNKISNSLTEIKFAQTITNGLQLKKEQTV